MGGTPNTSLGLMAEQQNHSGTPGTFPSVAMFGSMGQPGMWPGSSPAPSASPP